MGAMWLPTVAGVARAIRVGERGVESTVGANAAVTEYTVPTGRGTMITQASIRHSGGTAPTILFIELVSSAPLGIARPIRTPPVGAAQLSMAGTIWAAEGDDLIFGTVAGDDTTDFEFSWSGVEFDWVDVTV